MKVLGYLFLMFAALWTWVVLPENAAAASEQTKEPFFAPEAMTQPGPPEVGQKPFVPPEPGEEIPDWLARWELARLLSYSEKYDASVREYQRLLQEKPELTDARVELANVFYWKGEKDKALEILEKISPKEVKEEERLLMANIYVANKEYEKAEPIFRGYLQEHPDDAAVRLKLADMLSWVGKYEESLKAYETILEMRPDDIQVRRRYAFVLIWAGKPEKAARQLEKTLE